MRRLAELIELKLSELTESRLWINVNILTTTHDGSAWQCQTVW